ncbi:protein translocase subunit yidC [Alkalithermobacter thermoalcaliphilus JW-YL-7 = DSM 7308]|uniref:Membrane protein insertase, YidC/Oxa1 family n=1 Tax=Alkalithermobacter thermoalcaliphilus JW-YL-7 = DSM 7308 TaxID=1121328 RepID=A0A150FT52_CLOPD|nr:membrane protein insertase, YidC/Oxa1 family [[Clostridium] paradoxum JW-YL-7 = DSM 7308]SHL08615.1 protein translocase subunit yidC [[Clostridium] paradoxum JW-YL-7 = DSM 7308]
MSIIPQTLGVLLKLIFDIVGNYGLAIIIFTVVVKLALLPLTLSQSKSMKAVQEIQPKINDIKEKYRNDQQMMNQKIMEVYQENKINPMAGCLPLFIQFPILIGLFTVLRSPEIYVFGSEQAYRSIDTTFLWLSNLSDPDVILLGGIALPWILPILAGVTTYISSAMMTPNQGKKDPTQAMMTYLFPVLILWWGKSFPAGLTLYWVVSNVFQIAQQYFIMKPVSAKEE